MFDALDDIADQLKRLTAVLERLVPPEPPAPDLSRATLFSLAPVSRAITPAPDWPLPLDLLLGVDRQKQALSAEIDRFARGLPANHVLLWGARGTGKSSLVKSAVMDAAQRTGALKLIEVDRDDTEALPGLFARLRPLCDRIVVFCDDLSFEAGAHQAKALKSALEGGVQAPPENVLFIATSNRRHLAPRRREQADALAAEEEAEESVSVSDRFGLWLGFPPMDQPTYLAVVRAYAARFGLNAPDLDRRALQWAQARGGRSGRVAWQFTRALAGERNVRLF